ncbi:MAG: thioredoxin [Egibacteraceae bacterium]
MVTRDVTEASFDQDVVRASATRPVVVDFWAAWCGPCRQLSPLLERMAERYAGQIDVVKVDVDANTQLAARYRVQGIPAVKAFRDGKMVSEFVGLQPEVAIDRFFAALAPSEADRLVAEAATAAEPEPLLRKALAAERDHAGGAVALARLLSQRGERDEALALLERVPRDEAARKLAAELAIAEGDGADVEALQTAVQGGDDTARVPLGRALAALGRHAEAVEVLLPALDAQDERAAARTALLQVFEALGEEHEVVRDGRRRMASALFA